MPDLSLHHAATLAAVLAVLALIVRVVALLDERQRQRVARRMAADKDAAEALARAYNLLRTQPPLSSARNTPPRPWHIGDDPGHRP